MSFSSFFSVFNKSTFRPAKNVSPSHRAFGSFETIKQTLGASNLEETVKCPPGRDVNDWLAMNVVEFYNQLNIFYSIVETDCNEKTCPHMSAGKFQYFWQDDDKYKRPSDLPAHKYMELLMDWINEMLNDTKVFPDVTYIPYPSDFRKTVQKIFRRMFRVYAHIYFQHKNSMKEINGMGHLNTSFRHFYLFSKEFKLMDPKEYQVLQPIIDQFNSR